MGGTGNPSGNYATYKESVLNYNQRNGTGGLLIMYSKSLTNNGKIEANGVSSSTGNRSNGYGRIDPGGASGGGSVNIFYKENYESTGTGTITANGGAAITGEGGNTGGAGGNGTVSIGCVGTGTYISNN